MDFKAAYKLLADVLEQVQATHAGHIAMQQALAVIQSDHDNLVAQVTMFTEGAIRDGEGGAA